MNLGTAKVAPTGTLCKGRPNTDALADKDISLNCSYGKFLIMGPGTLKLLKLQHSIQVLDS